MRSILSFSLITLLVACSSRHPAQLVAETPPVTKAGAELAAGKTSFTTFEGFLSPQQQPGEETDAPKIIEKATGLQSTAPSIPREQRKSTGYGKIRFTKDLSRAFVDVEIAGVNPDD